MFKRAVTGFFVLSIASLANASTTTYTPQDWNLTSSNVSISGNQIYKSAGANGVKITAWANSGNFGVCGTGPECDPGSASYDQDPFLERAQLTSYSSGIGAINADDSTSDPHHALDNKGSNTNWAEFDMVLFEFDTAVELTGLRAGWASNDSDMTVLGYTGSTALDTNTPFASDDKWSDLVGKGWGYHTDVMNLGVNNTKTIAPGFESKYWLVGVYNPVFTGATNSSWDAVKLSMVSTRKADSQTSVPEPATFALMLAGVAALLRRKKTV
ncbi:exosortase-dependent surface protein XDP1 [Aliiglaciecola sp. LCG003]|uniref:exosortase-dependent surface protein XDP1 n=1 Tax=Aliiglaciecola sp. LCG003 TaxID=3053655 RepID=UPI0025729B43|nr:exosortase-dependent surface protein XDP1 [Aliiglaciecola sp. LCG003]WJG08400.1 PEP-CTERM sorting domain-containing protein [Aliiglaciecola sp. LCG003]